MTESLYIFRQGDLLKLDIQIDKGAEFTAWHMQWDLYCSLLQERMDEFPAVFNGQVRVMEGEQFHITLAEDAVPFCVKTPQTVPFVYRNKLKAEMDLLQQQGIMEPVTEATQLCVPIVVTPKEGTDKIRMCVDLSKLNCFVLRERYQSSTPTETIADIAANEASYFTIIDATKGYHQCPLAKDS